jgi:hypothetical protein
MSGWRKVSLSVQEVAAGKGIALQNQFTLLFRAAGAPRDAGMCKAADVVANDYYFSPAACTFATPLIATYRGEECPAPARSAVRMLVSHDGAEGIPFA